MEKLKLIQERQGFISDLLKDIYGKERHSEQQRTLQ